jgi:hypothetical protein
MPWFLLDLLNSLAERGIKKASLLDKLIVRDRLLCAGGHSRKMLKVVRNHWPGKSSLETDSPVLAHGNNQ